MGSDVDVSVVCFNNSGNNGKADHSLLLVVKNGMNS